MIARNYCSDVRGSSWCVGVFEFAGLAHLINGVTTKADPLPALYCRPEVPQEIA